MKKPVSPQIKLYDIYDYSYVPFWNTLWFKITVIALAVLSVGFIVYKVSVLLKNRKKTTTPWERATEKLSALEVNEVSYKKFYFDLTSILKTYLIERYEYDIQGMTDLEVIEYVKKSSFPSELIPVIQKIFEGPQHIKFGNQKAAIKQMEKDLEASKTIITCTKGRKGT